MIFAADGRGGFIVPEFSRSIDGVAAFARLLGLVGQDPADAEPDPGPDPGRAPAQAVHPDPVGGQGHGHADRGRGGRGPGDRHHRRRPRRRAGPGAGSWSCPTRRRPSRTCGPRATTPTRRPRCWTSGPRWWSGPAAERRGSCLRLPAPRPRPTVDAEASWRERIATIAELSVCVGGAARMWRRRRGGAQGGSGRPDAAARGAPGDPRVVAPSAAGPGLPGARGAWTGATAARVALSTPPEYARSACRGGHGRRAGGQPDEREARGADAECVLHRVR